MTFNITWEAYPSPNMTGGFANITSYANTTTDGLFGTGLLISLYMILFLSFRRLGDMEAFLASNFIITVLAGLFRALNLVGDLPFAVGVMLTALSLFLVFRRSQ
jgi:hypothetical protein